MRNVLNHLTLGVSVFGCASQGHEVKTRGDLESCISGFGSAIVLVSMSVSSCRPTRTRTSRSYNVFAFAMIHIRGGKFRCAR